VNILSELGIHVFERGWLSSNNVLCVGASNNTLVDTGYVDHAHQTIELVESALKGPLTAIVNTHLHSDHCGGNAALQSRFPYAKTWVPAPSFEAIQRWDGDALTYAVTGQTCPPFTATHCYQAGDLLRMGDIEWRAYAAMGHDPDAMLLYQAEHRILISGDALWGNGLGVMFPELDEADAFDAALETLNHIKTLEPLVVIPGHGAVFTDVADAIGRAEYRIKQWQSAPDSHYLYGLKVLVKFKLLSAQQITMGDLIAWAEQTPYLQRLKMKAITLLDIQDNERQAGGEMGTVIQRLVALLVRANAARVAGEVVYNVG
jgi:glyoxylase-like metal-dependent hydrolase (beta-lactamase superfamily II)